MFLELDYPRLFMCTLYNLLW